MKTRILPPLFLVLLFLAACGNPTPAPVTGPEREDILTFAEPRTDSLMASLNANDYESYTRDMDPRMKAAMTSSVFDQNRSLIMSKIGKYVSRQVASVDKTGDFLGVNYAARFEGEEGVSLRVVFNQSDHLISGLWMTSPKLRQ